MTPMTVSSAGRAIGPLLRLQVRALLYGLGVRRGSGRLRALGAAAGGAVFFSSHGLEVVEKLCATVAVIRAGELVASGPTDEVRGSDSLEYVFLELVDEKNGDAASRPDRQEMR